MVELIPTSPLANLLPAEIGDSNLAEIRPAHVTLILPRKGADLARAMQAAHGLKLPAPCRSGGNDRLRLIWAGLGKYLLVGVAPAAPALSRRAALVDQGGAYAIMRLQGGLATDILARLTPIDLRPTTFRRGHVALSELAHIPALILKRTNGADIMVPRSLAVSACSKLLGAMQRVNAQNGLSAG
ncbi:MAG: sarcosine oxidase subunit gamma [Paracoccaceae bacterium]|nr:sarcosine oxidase subunit gamma [Paracoccaceae bacterium]